MTPEQKRAAAQSWIDRITPFDDGFGGGSAPPWLTIVAWIAAAGWFIYAALEKCEAAR